MRRRPYAGLSRRDREAQAADMAARARYVTPLLDAASVAPVEARDFRKRAWGYFKRAQLRAWGLYREVRP